MSERTKNFRKYAQPVAEVAAAGMIWGLKRVRDITEEHHRSQTHRSVTLPRFRQKLIAFDQGGFGVKSIPVWAAVHRIHHSMPDVTLKPFYDIARAVDWMKENPEKAQGVTIPKIFRYLDKKVDVFSLEDVMEIGHQADELVKRRLKDTYKKPDGYTKEELLAILNPTAPQYYYPKDKHEGSYTQDDKARNLLSDPHSPLLIRPPEENGVRGVIKQNVKLYTGSADVFRAHPELMEEDLQKDHRDRSMKPEIIACIVIPSILALARIKHKRGKQQGEKGLFKPLINGKLEGKKDVAKAVTAGAAIDGISTFDAVTGGRIVNALGHAGRLTPQKLWAAIRNRVFIPDANIDGTLSTDTEDSGFLGRALSRLTFDEVGGQDHHHHVPGDIAYTNLTGWAAWKRAPWGSLLKTLAHSERYPFVNPGPGFDLKPGETRPDEPHPAVEIIHERRAEQLRAKNS